MNRVIVILLCLCSTVVCAFLAYMAFQTDDGDQIENQSPAEISCSDLLERIPKGLHRLTLTDFTPGPEFVSYDDDQNGEWERVFVPLFSVPLKELKQNYRAAIVCIADVTNEEQLNEKIDAGNLVAEYWYSSQSLDSRTYNQMAEHYNSMNFDRSIILYAGYPPSKGIFGDTMLWAASGGAALSIFVLGWQAFGLMLAGIRKEDSEEDQEEIAITNRAGVPTNEENEFD